MKILGNSLSRYAACLLIIAGSVTGCGGEGQKGTSVAGPDANAQEGTLVTFSSSVSGIPQRPKNLSCIAPPRPPQTVEVKFTPVFSALKFELPVGLMQAPGDNSRWFVLEQISGQVKQFANQPNVSTTDVFLDIRDRVYNDEFESGLLGMAFHPDFPVIPDVYVFYTRRGAPLTSYVSRFSSADGGYSLDAFSEQVLITIDQPSIMHQAGQIGFGPNGYLYISSGDGGIHPTHASPDVLNHGQDTHTLLGALLRIKVDNRFAQESNLPYAIPAENPFAAGGGRPEIFAWGFRNPWRWSIDPQTHQLWLADVGDNLHEEINLVERGGNYGWRAREGTDCSPHYPSECQQGEYIDPIYSYSHHDGCAIIGGHVYRGSAIQALQGQYIFGDFCDGQVWRLSHDDLGLPQRFPISTLGATISAFARDTAGELYVLEWEKGSILQLTANDEIQPHQFPRQLSQTGCVDPTNPSQPAPGLIPYEVNASFWSDNASKQRWLSLPDDSQIEILPTHDWRFPSGSVFMKHFELGGQLIETRLLVRHLDGGWGGYSYAWRADGSDADYVAGGKNIVKQEQEWHIPSSGQCMRCHTAASEVVLGLETAQMNRDHFYAASAVNANQLMTLSHLDLFNSAEFRPGHAYPKISDPFDHSVPMSLRARSYLHSNCAQCHQPGGPTRLDMDLRYTTPLGASGICGERPQTSDLGLEDAYLIAPGAPERSVLLERISRRDLYRMPPLASAVVDNEGVKLIQAWIDQLTGC